MRRQILILTLLVCAAFSIQALTPHHLQMIGENQLFPQPTNIRETSEQTFEATDDSSDEILRDAPAGRKVECMTQFSSYILRGGSLFGVPVLGKPTHYIIGDDGNLYLYNTIITSPFGNKPTESYIKAEKIDGKYIAKFPQAVMQDKDEILYINLAKPGAESYEIVESENNQVEFDIEVDGLIRALIQDEEKRPNYLLAAFNSSGAWSYYANYEMVYVPFTYSVVSPPADGDIEEWVMKYNQNGNDVEGQVNVILEQDDIWIQGLSQTNIPDEWAHGEIDGDKIYFDEYLGMAETVGQHVFLYKTLITAENNGERSNLVFNYDSDQKTLSLIGYELTVNPNPWIYYALERYENPVIQPKTTGIEDTLSDVECVSTQYFDISGREIKVPTEGIFIKKETFTNGKVKISKIIK